MTPTSESELDRRSAWLCESFDPERFALRASRATGLLRDYLTHVASREEPVWPGTDPEELLERWPDPEASGGGELHELLTEILADSTHQHHPGFVGQQLSAPPPLVGPVAMVAAILNNSAAIFEGAPVAIVMERRVVEWMKRRIGYGPGAGGVLTSGGTLGALTALLAMRQARIGSDSWRHGLSGRADHAVLVSDQAHYCNARACAVLGLGEQAVVRVGTNRDFRMTAASLEAAYRLALEADRRPVAVVANAGSTATGSYDDVEAAAGFCETHDLWLHVDAAHGGSALLCPRYASLLSGIERADSVVWDAHKMLAMPSLCTGVLVRDAARLDDAFRQDASYLLADSEAPWHEPAARNFETTKPALALPLYVALRMLGPDYFIHFVEYTYDLARAFADEVESREEFELLTRPQANIVCFRLRAAASNADEVQLRARDAVNRRGHFFLMRATLRDAVWLRVVLMNPATRLADLRALLDELSREKVTSTALDSSNEMDARGVSHKGAGPTPLEGRSGPPPANAGGHA